MIWKIIFVAGLMAASWICLAIIIGVINDYRDLRDDLKDDR